MTVARSVSDVLADHVTLEVECIDRMFLNVYVPKLQFVGGVVSCLGQHRGHRFASSALLEPISRPFVEGLRRFARDEGVPLVDFAKGQRKDDVAHEFLAGFEGDEGVLFVGRAQERSRPPTYVVPSRRRENTVIIRDGASFGEVLSRGRSVRPELEPAFLGAKRCWSSTPGAARVVGRCPGPSSVRRDLAMRSDGAGEGLMAPTTCRALDSDRWP